MKLMHLLFSRALPTSDSAGMGAHLYRLHCQIERATNIADLQQIRDAIHSLLEDWHHTRETTEELIRLDAYCSLRRILLAMHARRLNSRPKALTLSQLN